MDRTMKAAVMTGIEQLEIQTRPIPAPAPGEVLIKTEYVGVCGSDLHYYHSGAIGSFIVEPPFVLGHEAAGTVVALGAGVTNLKVGDRVAMEPGRTCGHCEFCRTGRYNLCPEVRFWATPPYDGVFQEYVTHDADLCFVLPENVSTMEGALIEPLAVGFHAAIQGNARLGQTALVTGAGCIGLVSLLALKARGVSTVFVLGKGAVRLAKAASLGADAVIDAENEDAVARIMELTDGKGVDLVIETAGAELSTRQSILSLKPDGTLVLVGYSPSGEMTLPVSEILNREITVKSVFRYRHIYPVAIDAVASGKVDLKGIVSHSYSFDDIADALHECIYNKKEVIKGVIKMP